jgi:predicted phosphohydrolase
MKRILLIIFTTICLSTVYAENRDINIALLADLHITAGNNNDKIMRELVDDINSAKYDLVIVAGDLTNMGTFDELKCAYDHLKRIKHRKLITHGNHETTWSPSAGKDFEKLWGHNGCTTARVLDYLFVAFPAGPFIKMADGTAQDGARLQWVESRLKKGKAGKIISVCHYPLNADLTNREQVVELMKRYGSRKLFQMLIKLKRTVVAMDGPERGRKIDERILGCEQPSILAASEKSSGIDLKNSVISIR